MKNEEIWLLCPLCKCKTRIRILKETEMKMFPLYCPKCKKETLIDVKEQTIEIIKWPDAQTQS